MSISRRRAGRKSWATRQQFGTDLKNFFTAFAAKEWKYDQSVTGAMQIERNDRNGQRVISFSQAYGEISNRMDKSFANISDDGLSDMLTASFLQKARIALGSVEYRLVESESG